MEDQPRRYANTNRYSILSNRECFKRTNTAVPIVAESAAGLYRNAEFLHNEVPAPASRQKL